jgi:hypothetical protein
MVALYALWYNFVRVHKTLRMSPAMAAGVAGSVMVDGRHRCLDRPARGYASRSPFGRVNRYGRTEAPAGYAPRKANPRENLGVGPQKMSQRERGRLSPLIRAVIEVGFIIFLFYSNLLMGEFTRGNGAGKGFLTALEDIFTISDFTIAVISALIGFVIVEYLRRKL